MKAKVEGLMVDRMDRNQEIVTRYLNEPEFQDLAFKEFVRRFDTDISAGQLAPPAVVAAALDVRGWPGSWDCSSRSTAGRSQRGRRRPSGGCSSRRTR